MASAFGRQVRVGLAWSVRPLDTLWSGAFVLGECVVRPQQHSCRSRRSVAEQILVGGKHVNEQPIVSTDKAQSHAQHASPERNMWMFS